MIPDFPGKRPGTLNERSLGAMLRAEDWCNDLRVSALLGAQDYLSGPEVQETKACHGEPFPGCPERVSKMFKVMHLG